MSDIVSVEFIYLPVINFAMQQNRIRPIRQLSIENKSGDTLKNVKVILTTEPEFSTSTPYFIEVIPANETIRVDSMDLNLSANYFAQLTERLAGHFILEVFSDDDSIFKQTYPIDILAYDQWGGISVLPEMLSAFITPNHPAISSIIKRAAIILEQWTGSPSLDEYQSRNPDRVRKQMAAIYTAISEQNIIYSTVPASYEEYGQRVRLANTIMAQKLGTCLDMALLYASCLEAIGIHALIIVTNGHAFAGAWLVPDTFPDSIIDDSSFLTKRTADGINEITLVEATCMNMGNGSDFDQAVKTANNNINSSNFILALDVKRSRFAGIRPLPQRILNGVQWEIKEDIKLSDDKSQLAPQSVNPYDLSGINEEIVVTKQLLWERKLLDLSLRNNLLNIRITKNTLQLISANLDLFEDALAEGVEFQITPKPTDWDNPLFDFGLYQKLSDTDPFIDLVKSELSQKRLRSYLSDNDLAKALTHLYRSSRTAMEENGANTLYLALGLLKWYETPSSERPRYAPILLLPVEIVRKSAAKGYVIRSREEDTMMNITLLEMLRQNFGITISGLDPLPVDESGVNVKLIYSIIRNSIKNQRKWDVEEQAILGIFSFSKFIMWNDIHNNSHKLIENKLVSSLINGKIEWDVVDEMADATILDKQLSPSDIALPINADSSQLEAIYEAVNNKSFILHGPPGTGKSQTITNIIANALYRGKRVLFVAEKMAALSVVQNRLSAIGLAPFCLELHSNKTKKTAILNQLRETTEVIKHESPEDFQKEANRLLSLRQEINKYIEALHKKYPFGASLYSAISQYLSSKAQTEFNIPQSLIETLTKETVSEWHEALESLISIGHACGHPYNHPLTGISIANYSSTIKEEASVTINEAIAYLSKIKNNLSVFSNLIGSDQNTSYNKKQISTLTAIVSKMLSIHELTPDLLTSSRLNEVLDECKEVVPHGNKKDDLKSKISHYCTEQILQINARQLLNEWNSCSNKWFLPKLLGQRKVKKELKIYSLSSSIDSDNVGLLLSQIVNYQEEMEYLNKHTTLFPILFGKFGKKDVENWNAIEQIIDDTSILNTLILSYSQDVSKAANIKGHIARQLSEGIASFKSIQGSSLIELNELLIKMDAIDNQLSVQLGVDLNLLYSDSVNWIDEATSKLNKWLKNIDKLKDWYQWLSICDRFNRLNIAFVTDDYKNKNIDTDLLSDIFNKSLNKAYINYIISVEPDLELFKGKLFNDIIKKYKEITAKFEDLTKKELFARLASNIPSFTREATQNSEVGILQRNIKNNTRGISIRRLFDQIPTLLARMCPCMLMSPISVAQYIDPEAEKFDLIIFDEASQMPTYEAIGAIARGANIVIVGDPKQMPPTNFFSSNSVDEENIEMEDLESILDDCLALSMPSKYLLWHYRSKHESLIAFSNSEYYDNKLLTFPSPDNIESKVKFVPIEGFYDKGKSRQNKAEAQAVVDDIARRLRDPELRKRSIGVVTFSSVQQSLIEDLLSDLFIFHPDLESLALECEEPIFIKNLENVQGDERDVILFSVGYGPDKDGKVSMNFGPLNRLGGERRLNVAVSRARYEMTIYSTLRSDHIDLNKTSSIGVAGLKRFLAYAEKGEQIVSDKKLLNIETSSSGIEHIIANKLQEYGYTVHTNVGCSGYRVDIGVVDKNNPSNYILGILCDGENYTKTKTTRDREIVQSSVLRQLGWNICNIWTMDWWENPTEVIEHILDVIKNTEKNINNPIKVETGKTSIPESVKKKTEAIENKLNNNTNPDKIKNSTVQQNIEYVPASLKTVNYPADAFFLPENRSLILKQINEVMNCEAPISKSLLCKRVLSAWGITRLVQKIETYFDSLLDECNYYKSKHEDISFFWTNENNYREYTIYRTNSKRDAVDLPPEEIANGMKKILAEDISLPIADLSRLTAQLFGFARSGSNVDAAMSRGLKVAIDKGYMKEENGRAITI